MNWRWTTQFGIRHLRPTIALAGVLAAATPRPAYAHFFTQPYTLPVPFWMYAWGSAAALLVSFLIAALFTRVPQRASPSLACTSAGFLVPGWLVRLGQFAALTSLLLCTVAGMIGTQMPLNNINMTLFWIVFVLCVPYAVAVAGNFYAAINPWKALAMWLEGLRVASFSGRRPYPTRWRYWPALLLYMGFIWLELFGHVTPRGLSLSLLAYTAINLWAAWLYGAAAWFRFGEVFSVILELIGRLAPVDWQMPVHGGVTRIRGRMPFKGLLESPASDISLVLIILFMLSSTAFDGLHSTSPWVTLFWKDIFQFISPLLGSTAAAQIRIGNHAYLGWQWTVLFLSPFMYLGFFWIFQYATAHIVRTSISTKDFVLRFAMSLIPIAFVYHVTHYYTLLLVQIGELARLSSDPFGLGWNLFGTAASAIEPWMLDVEVIWHTQVGLILGGHIVSVFIAHIEAMRIFNSSRAAALSQLPMLLLMVLFTAFGLWILSLPIAPGA